jgi:arabinose-5-phosphate isomerase
MEISKGRLGACAVIESGKLKGVITDGDLRRMLESKDKLEDLKASDIMNVSPKSIESSALAVDALKLMQDHNISQLIVTETGGFIGFIHIHDLMREGIL